MAVLGVTLSAFLIERTDLAQLHVQLDAVCGWLSIAMALEVARMLAELWSTRNVLGQRASTVPPVTLLRGQLMCFAFSTLLPAGRAVGEATKAAIYCEALPAAIAGSAAVVGQTLTLITNGLVGLFAAVLAVRTPHGAPIAALCLPYGAGLLAVGVALAAVVRSPRVASWMGRLSWTARWSAQLVQAAQHNQRVGIGALLPQLLARAVQMLQLAVLAGAFAQALPWLRAPILQAIYGLGAAAGDLMPAQIGTVDAAFVLGSEVLGMSAASLVALALALHVVQVVVACACCLVAAWLSQSSRLAPRGAGPEARRQLWET